MCYTQIRSFSFVENTLLLRRMVGSLAVSIDKQISTDVSSCEKRGFFPSLLDEFLGALLRYW